MDIYFNRVQEYLLDLGYEIVSVDQEESMFIVNNESAGIYNLIIDCEDPILIIEQYLFDMKADNIETYKALLKMNREVVHGAFTLDSEGKKVIFRDTLQLENLDLNELQASLNALELLLSEFSDELIAFANNK